MNLDGGLDTSANLQISHDSDSLADYSQCLHAAHDDLNPPTPGTLTIKLVDFSAGGDNWEITASHDSGSETWSRGSGFAYYDFDELSSEVGVDIIATSDASPPQTKTRTIWVKTIPTSGLAPGA